MSEYFLPNKACPIARRGPGETPREKRELRRTLGDERCGILNAELAREPAEVPVAFKLATEGERVAPPLGRDTDADVEPEDPAARVRRAWWQAWKARDVDIP